jgi:hypothetical protein
MKNIHLKPLGKITLTNKSNLTESEIIQIIKEEYNRASRRKTVREQELGSLSKIEIQELLANYFYRHGGKIPENIYKLSVLFPVLKNAGLGNVVKSYQKTVEAFGKEAGKHILDDVKEAIHQISNPDYDQTAALQEKEQRLYSLLNNMTIGDKLRIPFTSSKLARDEMGQLDETGQRFVWTVENINVNETDLFESELELRHDASGTSSKMSYSELMDYQAYKHE